MAVLSLQSNVSSLLAQRQLGVASKKLNASFQALSSGLRINRASDDAAGLAIASQLEVDTHVYTQGLRNVNDAVSLLNIAQGALGELSNLVIRQQELAEEAANGTLGSKQRLALHQEASQLVAEYNRIVATLQFNNRALLDRSTGPIRIQYGYGDPESTSFNVAESVGRITGDGTFQAGVSYPAGARMLGIVASDFNNDGILDLAASTPNVANRVAVYFGNGDGTFKARTTYAAGPTQTDRIEIADFNEDGIEDLLTSQFVGTTATVLLGNSDGTFRAALSYASGSNVEGPVSDDVNRDGHADIVSTSNNTLEMMVLLGNGNGTFAAPKSYAGAMTAIGDVRLADLNGDLIVDATVGDATSLNVLIGNGDGSFRARVSYNTGGNVFQTGLGDYNNDGYVDAAVLDTTNDRLAILFGNGDGSFKAQQTYGSSTDTWALAVADLNGDGALDLTVPDNTVSTVSIYLNNGDGTFLARTSYTTISEVNSAAIGDYNGDGAPDVALGAWNTNAMDVHLANTVSGITTMPSINLATQSNAWSAITTLKECLKRVAIGLGALGAYQSRMETTISDIGTRRNALKGAASQIIDADVATEAAELVRSRILQQAAAAVLAQANQTPALALRLIGRG